MNLRLVFTLLAIAIAGCTPYQKIGTSVAGGHSFRQLSADVFTVVFLANGFTQPKRASDFALLRAAEVCLEHSFKYFSIIGEGDRSSSEIIHTGGTAYTTGTVNSFGGYSGTTTYRPMTTPVFKPGSEITIKCYETLPGGHVGKVEDAAKVASSLKAKYHLNKKL